MSYKYKVKATARHENESATHTATIGTRAKDATHAAKLADMDLAKIWPCGRYLIREVKLQKTGD